MDERYGLENGTTSRGRVFADDKLAQYPVEVIPRPPGKKWGRLMISDPDMKRKKRVAEYKLYSMEGKVKASFRKGYRWFKKTVSVLVHGY